MSSMELSVTEMKHEDKMTDNKNMEGYKFFDAYLNKKFFDIVHELI